MKIKYLLFDVDGVLVQHTDKLFSDRIVAEYGASDTDVRQFFEEVFPLCIVGKKDMRDELSSRLQAWHWPGTADELMEYWYTYEQNIDQPLIDYVRSITKAGVTACVATNNDHYRAASLFRCLNLDISVFEKLYAAGDMKVAKPDSAYFQHVLNDLLAEPAEVLFWDDTPRHIEAALALGIHAELYTTFDDFKEKMKQYV